MTSDANRRAGDLAAGRQLPADLVPLYDSLYEVAPDVRWSSQADAGAIWGALDAETWERTHNAWLVLQAVSEASLQTAAGSESWRSLVDRTASGRKAELAVPGWFREQFGDPTTVAYFSMEFGVGESLPIYSGGLGGLAGDIVKTASDLDVPMVGVGLFYQQGFFRQALSADYEQVELRPTNDPLSLPLRPAVRPDGSLLRFALPIAGRSIWVRAWRAQVGRASLLLLDTNDPANSPRDRDITSSLYPADREMRLIQELALGVGGWRALEELEIEPDLCHMNEGHAAFVVIARALTYMRRTGRTFREALWATRAGNVFTTHTAVPAGFDVFEAELATGYLQTYAREAGVFVEELLNMGRLSEDAHEPLNMAYLAMRGSSHANAVSELHAHVSQRLFANLYPRWPFGDVPVAAVTNGVHLPSWRSAAAAEAWDEEATDSGAGHASSIKPEELWRYRCEARGRLVERVRERLARQLAARGAPEDERQRASLALDPNALTIGFARRFTEYKRPNLLLRDAARLVRILSDANQPAQLVVAGKAHPNDAQGKEMIQTMARFAALRQVRSSVVFLEDYDLAMMQELAAGVDVWLNTPRRPWEASGTSGMKVLPNGGLNLSTLDGWWAEAYGPEYGWALGDGQEHSAAWDDIDAEQLYEILERQVIPTFYDRNRAGVPVKWVEMVRASMAELTETYSAARMVREYAQKLYLPALDSYRRRTADGGRLAAGLAEWDERIEAGWSTVSFGAMRVNRSGSEWAFETPVRAGRLGPELLRVEVYFETNTGVPTPIPMENAGPGGDEPNMWLYRAAAPGDRPLEHFNPRILPYHPDALVPMEQHRIHWYHA